MASSSRLLLSRNTSFRIQDNRVSAIDPQLSAYVDQVRSLRCSPSPAASSTELRPRKSTSRSSFPPDIATSISFESSPFLNTNTLLSLACPSPSSVVVPDSYSPIATKHGPLSGGSKYTTPHSPPESPSWTPVAQRDPIFEDWISSEERLHILFGVMDLNGDGFIDSVDLSNLCIQLGDRRSPNKIGNLLWEVDDSRARRLSESSFVALFKPFFDDDEREPLDGEPFELVYLLDYLWVDRRKSGSIPFFTALSLLSRRTRRGHGSMRVSEMRNMIRNICGITDALSDPPDRPMAYREFRTRGKMKRVMML